jgi:hypothetical protein
MLLELTCEWDGHGRAQWDYEAISEYLSTVINFTKLSRSLQMKAMLAAVAWPTINGISLRRLRCIAFHLNP